MIVRRLGGFAERDRERLERTDLVLLVNERGEVVQRYTGGARGPSRILDRIRGLLG